MLLEVIVEADPLCPRCEKLIPKLRRICDELNIPFTIRYVGGSSPASYAESVVTHTFSPEWVEEWGLEEHKRKLKKLEPVLRYLSRTGTAMTPTVIIRWHDGARLKEIVVRGYDTTNEEASRRYLTNIYVLLRMLKKVVTYA